jgi:gas vesicle protein
MSRDNSFGSFLTGLTTGLVAGAVAGILLAPKSGEETRKDLEKVGKKLKEDFDEQYSLAKKEVLYKVKQAKKLGAKLDESNYKAIVNDVVSELKDDASVTKEASSKLAGQLKTDWSTVKRQMTKRAPVTKSKKSVK